eukprot:3342696-Rhodomonas_salina.1
MLGARRRYECTSTPKPTRFPVPFAAIALRACARLKRLTLTCWTPSVQLRNGPVCTIRSTEAV